MINTDTISVNDIRRLSVDEYHAMAKAGILTEDDQVELIEGWLVKKMTKNPPHRVVTQLTREALAAVLPVGWFVDAQEPITLSDSEPEPDVAVIRGDRRDYVDRHLGPQDAALVVEVADSSLQRDKTVKKRLYAAAGIPELWIINLTDRCLEQYREPDRQAKPPDYARYTSWPDGAELSFAISDKTLTLAVSELLP